MRFNDLPADLRWNMYRTSRDKLITDYTESGQTPEMQDTLRSLIASIVEKMDHLRNTELGGDDGDYDEYQHNTSYDPVVKITVDETNEMFKYENKTKHEIDKMKLQDRINALIANTPGATDSALVAVQGELRLAQEQNEELKTREINAKIVLENAKNKLKEAVAKNATDVNNIKIQLKTAEDKLNTCKDTLSKRSWLTTAQVETLLREKNEFERQVGELKRVAQTAASNVSASSPTVTDSKATDLEHSLVQENGSLKDNIAALNVLMIEKTSELKKIVKEKNELAAKVEELTAAIEKIQAAQVSKDKALEDAKVLHNAAIMGQIQGLKQAHTEELKAVLDHILYLTEDHSNDGFVDAQTAEQQAAINAVKEKYPWLNDRMESIQNSEKDHIAKHTQDAKEALQIEHAEELRNTKAAHEDTKKVLATLQNEHARVGLQLKQTIKQLEELQEAHSSDVDDEFQDAAASVPPTPVTIEPTVGVSSTPVPSPAVGVSSTPVLQERTVVELEEDANIGFAKFFSNDITAAAAASVPPTPVTIEPTVSVLSTPVPSPAVGVSSTPVLQERTVVELEEDANIGFAKFFSNDITAAAAASASPTPVPGPAVGVLSTPVPGPAVSESPTPIYEEDTEILKKLKDVLTQDHDHLRHAKEKWNYQYISSELIKIFESTKWTPQDSISKINAMLKALEKYRDDNLDENFKRTFFKALENYEYSKTDKRTGAKMITKDLVTRITKIEENFQVLKAEIPLTTINAKGSTKQKNQADMLISLRDFFTKTVWPPVQIRYETRSSSVASV